MKTTSIFAAVLAGAALVGTQPVRAMDTKVAQEATAPVVESVNMKAAAELVRAKLLACKTVEELNGYVAGFVGEDSLKSWVAEVAKMLSTAQRPGKVTLPAYTVNGVVVLEAQETELAA